MAVDSNVVIEKINNFEQMFVLFSTFTHHPFIVCDEETFDDQIYVFTSEEMMQAFAKRFTADKYHLRGVEVKKEMIPSFFKSLYLLGVNAVMVQDEGAPVRVQLSELAEKPDVSALKRSLIPQANPELQLTGLYFMQELMRPLDRNIEEKKRLQSLEEDMAHYLLNSRFVVTFDVTAVQGRWDPTKSDENVKVPLVKTKRGDIYQPIYTDFGEMQSFNRFNKDVRLEMTAVPYERLSDFLVNDSRGFVFNPGGFNLILTREQIAEMLERYGEGTVSSREESVETATDFASQEENDTDANEIEGTDADVMEAAEEI
uniref:SseB family protein n=1 Tax=Eubacterium cellulosolvens TaxID=29322 RepID=UPI00048215CD|nr:SseB family protein [[Eubacterium] cellulosolvens]